MTDLEDAARPTSWSRVIVMAVYDDPRRDPTVSAWHALWEGEVDPTQPLGEFDGTREDAIAWARSRKPSEILVFDPETGKLSPTDL
jgi:hypothetical protein